MFGWRLVRTQEYERLLEDVDFWRQAFSGERTRNDRLTDSVVQSAGRPPVSDEGIAEMNAFKEKTREAIESFAATQDDDMELLPSIVADMLAPNDESEGAKKAN